MSGGERLPFNGFREPPHGLPQAEAHSINLFGPSVRLVVLREKHRLHDRRILLSEELLEVLPVRLLEALVTLQAQLSGKVWHLASARSRPYLRPGMCGDRTVIPFRPISIGIGPIWWFVPRIFVISMYRTRASPATGTRWKWTTPSAMNSCMPGFAEGSPKKPGGDSVIMRVVHPELPMIFPRSMWVNTRTSPWVSNAWDIAVKESMTRRTMPCSSI